MVSLCRIFSMLLSEHVKTNSGETNPAEETNPGETHPADETNPVETHPANEYIHIWIKV